MEHGNDPEATPATATSNQRNVNCVPTCPCSSENPAQQLDEYQKMAEEIMIRQNVQEEEKEEIGATQDEEENNPTNPTTTSSAQLRHNDKDKKAKSSQEDAAAQLSLMSLKTAAAIAL